MPIVSVIVPVYKVEPYIHRCIDSILTQTYTDFELILVDDGSPDNSGAICDAYAAKDNRIKVIHKENAGVSSARNAGLDIASGEYITFVDSDDYCKQNWLSELYCGIVTSDADIASGDYTIVDEKGKVISTTIYEKFSKTIDDEWELVKHIACDILLEKLGWAVWTRIFRAEIIQKNHIRFCESCENFAEDMGFVLEYSLYCKRIACVSSCGYQYVQREGSMMEKSKGQIRLNPLNEVSCQFANRIASLNSAYLQRSIPLFHYLIMNNQYSQITNRWEKPNIAAEISKIQNKKWYFQQANLENQCKKLMIDLLGKEKARAVRIFYDYMRNDNWLLFQIKRYLLLRTQRRYLYKKILGERIYYWIKNKVMTSTAS